MHVASDARSIYCVVGTFWDAEVAFPAVTALRSDGEADRAD